MRFRTVTLSARRCTCVSARHSHTTSNGTTTHMHPRRSAIFRIDLMNRIMCLGHLAEIPSPRCDLRNDCARGAM